MLSFNFRAISGKESSACLLIFERLLFGTIFDSFIYIPGTSGLVVARLCIH